MLRDVEIDGRKVAFNDDPEHGTEFLVQVGKGKGAYKTRYSFRGNPWEACKYYRCINTGPGFKKRLYAPGMNKPTIAKYLG